MVAYSFKKQFGPPILAGTKAQTIRDDRKRHVRPGEMVQLFTGMRTKHCRRLGEAQCVAIERVMIVLPTKNHVGAVTIEDLDARYVGGSTSRTDLNGFAHRDGFAGWDAMVAFWRENHPGQETFSGVLIRWQPLVPANALDIAGAA